jgi:hypothetical protein
MPSPIFSTKRHGQKIGYTEGDQALDLFNRVRAAYDSNTSLLRHPNTRAILGYVALNGNFVGSWQTAKELFPEADSVPVGDDESNAGAAVPAARSDESAAERLDASGSHVENHDAACAFPADHADAAFGALGPAIPQQTPPNPANNQALSALARGERVSALNFKFDDDVRHPRSAQQFEDEGGTGADENSAPYEATPWCNGALAADSRSKREAAPEAFSYSSQIERGPVHEPASRTEHCYEPAWPGEPEPLNEQHRHCEPDDLGHLKAPQIETASMAVSESSEVSVPEPPDAERQGGDADPSDCGALLAVDSFMLHLAEYLDTRLSPIAMGVASSRPAESSAGPFPGSDSRNEAEHKVLRDEPYTDSPNLVEKREPFGRPAQGAAAVSPGDTQNAVGQDRSIPGPVSDSSGLEDRESSPTKRCGDDDLEEAPEELSDLAQSNETASPVLSAEDTARPPNVFATSAEIVTRSSAIRVCTE